MSKHRKLNEDALRELINRVQSAKDYISSLNNKEVSSSETRMVQGPYLHQGTNQITEKESAKFERDNKLIFDELQNIIRIVREKLKN